MKLTDVGVNLTDKRFAPDLDAVITRAREAHVVRQIITGTNIEESRYATELAARFSGLYSTCGIHPHQAKDFTADSLSALRQLAAEETVVAIGETGLDFNRDFSPRNTQEAAYSAQLELASELSLPVFLHQRDAHDRFLPMLKEYRQGLPNAVVHCFTGNKKELFDCLDLDCYVGITGWVCDERRGKSLQDIVNNIPLNRLLIETDSPYLTPRNMTGKPEKSGRNEPALLIWILRQLANCYDVEPVRLAQHTWQNSTDCFALPDEPNL